MICPTIVTAPFSSEEHAQGGSYRHASDKWNLEMTYAAISHLFISHSSLRITFEILRLFSGITNKGIVHALVTVGSFVFLYGNHLNTKSIWNKSMRHIAEYIK